MKVWPKNDTMRKLLRHPSSGGFRETGPAEWLGDSFTHRLLRDGDILPSDPMAKPASIAAEAPRRSTHKRSESESSGED